MKYRNILVPYDRSESAKNALATALQIAAENPGAHVTAFFAAPMPEFESSQFIIAERMSGSIRIPKDQIASMQKEYMDYERELLTKDLGDVAAKAGDTLSVELGQASRARRSSTTPRSTTPI